MSPCELLLRLMPPWIFDDKREDNLKEKLAEERKEHAYKVLPKWKDINIQTANTNTELWLL